MKKVKSFFSYIGKSLAHHWVIVVVTIIATAGAAVGGVLIGSSVFRQTYDPNAVDVVEDDIEALYKRYQECGGDYSSFEPYELANIGLYKATLHDSLRIVSKGDVVAAGVSQTVRGYSIKNNDSYFMENISKGLISCSWRMYQTSSVKAYPGHDIDVETAKYDEGSASEYSLDDYASTWGKLLSRPNIYIISEDTVLEKSVSQEGSEYHVDLNLDPNKAVVNYVKQMKMVSGLSDYPVFYKVNLKFTLDSELNLKKINTAEQYEVNKLGVHLSDGTLEDVYYYDEATPIPELNTPVVY